MREVEVKDLKPIQGSAPSKPGSSNRGTALELVHRLLFRALLTMRTQGHEQKNKVVFHLADLFHNVVLEMENAAEGKTTYEDILGLLEEKAKENGCERWLSTTLAEMEASQPPSPTAL